MDPAMVFQSSDTGFLSMYGISGLGLVSQQELLAFMGIGFSWMD
jgi:hypothetical protein